MKHKSKDLKLRAILYYYKSKNQTQTSKIFGCSPRTLMRWVNKFNNCYSFSKNNKMYLGYKLKQVHINYINNCLLQNKTITIKELKKHLLLEFSLNTSPSHLHRVVKKIGFSLKKVKLKHKPNTCYDKVKDVNILLKEFYLTVHKFKIKDIICIDETSLSSFLIRNYGYSKKGKRCVIQTNNQNVFKKYTGILSYTIYSKGGMNSNRLIEFLNKFLSEQKNKLIILDNASSHKNRLVQNTITKNNSLLYSVPYQHGTQAIEGFSNVLKSRLKQKSSDLSYNNLCLNIKNVISEIPKSFYLNLIKGTYRK
jgi:transposase